MLYRICCWINEVYPLAVFFLYIGLFLVAFAAAFLIPAVAILVLIFSILALVPFVFLNRLLQLFERVLAPDSGAEAGVTAGATEDA
ncbi:MAG: hypothetical protein MK085_06360 [Phycisphaerales bacterium]|nr:hypothetical protein [Phycisphaerales bacterium]